MITILSAALGFAGSFVPDLLKLWRGAQDNKHELAMLDKQIEFAKLNHQQRLEEVEIWADVSESEALNRRVVPMGIKWVDALSGSVRPIITYCFFLSYVLVKIAQFYSLQHIDPLPWLNNSQQVQNWFAIVLQLWNQEDQALFAAVMAFWFGDRSLTRRRAGK